MARHSLCGRPVCILLLLAAFILVAHVAPCSATKEVRQDGRPKVPKQHHRSPAHHQHQEAGKDAAVEPAKKAHHHPAAKAPAPVGPTEGHHRSTLRAKGPGSHHRAAEHHVDKHVKHRMEEPKRRLEVQKPPKPFLQPPLLPKHERPPKHHVKQDKEKHH